MIPMWQTPKVNSKVMKNLEISNEDRQFFKIVKAKSTKIRW